MPHTTRRRSRPQYIHPRMFDALESRVLLTAAPAALPAVSIMVTRNASETKGLTTGSGLFTVSRKGGSNAGSLTINYSVDIASTATAGVDYQTLSGQVIIPAGKPSATIPVLVNDDGVAEPAETVILTLLSDAAYTLNPLPNKQKAQMAIADNASTVSIAKSHDGNEAKGSTSGMAAFTISRQGGDRSGPLTVTYEIAGISEAGVGDQPVDTPLTITIPAGKPSAKISLPVSANIAFDPSQVIILHLDGGDAYRLDVNPARQQAIAKVKQAQAVDFLNLAGFDTDGSTWDYAVRASHGVTGTASAQNSSQGGNTWQWDTTITPDDPDVDGADENFTWQRDFDGVRLVELVESTAGGSATLDFDNLLLSGPILAGSVTSDSNVTVNLDGISGDLNGTAHCVAKVVGPAHITVPAGTFDAMQVTMTLSFSVRGTVNNGERDINVALHGTDINTFYLVQNVGIVKIVSTASETATVSGSGTQSVNQTITSQLLDYDYVPPV